MRGRVEAPLAALGRHPRSIGVADSWAAGDHEDLGEQQRSEEIDALSHVAPLILTSGREWGRQLEVGELGNVVVVPKPYDLDDLIERVRRSSRRTSPWLQSTER